MVSAEKAAQQSESLNVGPTVDCSLSQREELDFRCVTSERKVPSKKSVGICISILFKRAHAVDMSLQS